MVSPGGPVKNPARVPLLLQQLEPWPAEMTGSLPVSMVQPAEGVTTVATTTHFKAINAGPNAGMFEVTEDGIFENPKTKDRFQFRAKHVVPAPVANFKRVGPWPEEATEEEKEAAETEAKAEKKPEDKAETAAPENKSA
jgi:hypothetical protein